MLSRRSLALLCVLVLAGCAGEAAYDDEARDYGVPPTNAIRADNHDDATPTTIEGARTIRTLALRNMLNDASRPPLLIDVLDDRGVSLPGAVRMPGLGGGVSFYDDVQRGMSMRLAARTNDDRNQPIVFFCLSKLCWLSHNAVVRAVALGYTNVYWYRGGRSAWRAAGLPMTRSEREESLF